MKLAWTVSREVTLEQVPQTSFVYLVPYYLPRKSVLALLNSKSEVDIIYLTFTKELALQVKPIAPWDAFWHWSTEIW